MRPRRDRTSAPRRDPDHAILHKPLKDQQGNERSRLSVLRRKTYDENTIKTKSTFAGDAAQYKCTQAPDLTWTRPTWPDCTYYESNKTNHIARCSTTHVHAYSCIKIIRLACESYSNSACFVDALQLEPINILFHGICVPSLSLTCIEPI